MEQEKQLKRNQVTQSGSIIPETVTWYFAFCDGDEYEIPRWQRVALGMFEHFRKDEKVLNHCFAFCQIGPYLQFVEPSRNMIVLSIKADDIQGRPFLAEDAKALLEDRGCLVERLEYTPDLGSWKHCLTWVPSCVSALKIICALPTLALTPRQLYNWVKRNQTG